MARPTSKRKPKPRTRPAQRIAPLLPVGITLRCSPMRRCGMLADAIVALRPDLQVQRDARLAEMNFGGWEGRPWAAIAREEFEAWTGNFADAPAGLHGETVRAFMRRVADAYADWLAGDGGALWVTHAGVLRAVQLLGQGVSCPERADQWPTDAAPLGGWRVVERN
jgi:alpha-ribazole phosphatase